MFFLKLFISFLLYWDLFTDRLPRWLLPPPSSTSITTSRNRAQQWHVTTTTTTMTTYNIQTTMDDGWQRARYVFFNVFFFSLLTIYIRLHVRNMNQNHHHCHSDCQHHHRHHFTTTTSNNTSTTVRTTTEAQDGYFFFLLFFYFTNNYVLIDYHGYDDAASCLTSPLKKVQELSTSLMALKSKVCLFFTSVLFC